MNKRRHHRIGTLQTIIHRSYPRRASRINAYTTLTTTCCRERGSFEDKVFYLYVLFHTICSILIMGRRRRRRAGGCCFGYDFVVAGRKSSELYGRIRCRCCFGSNIGSSFHQNIGYCRKTGHFVQVNRDDTVCT